MAATALADAGFTDVDADARSPAGTDFALQARDARRTLWYVDVAGGFTAGPSGLRRADLLWRAVGMAHTIRAHDPECRVLVLTSELPTSTGKHAVRHLVDSGVPVLDLGAADLLARTEGPARLTTWDPGQYLQFGEARLRPALDLLARIEPADPPTLVVDLGCGPGNLTARSPSGGPTLR